MYKKIAISLLSIGMSCVFANSGEIPSIKKGQVLSSSFSALISDDTSSENIIKEIYQGNFRKSTTDWSSIGDFTFERNQISDSCVACINNYASNINDSISSPDIILPSIDQLKEKIVLSYNESYELESSYDFGRVYVSVNGSDWKMQHSVTGRNNKNTTHIDVSKFAGKTIRLKYELTSDDSYEYFGWEISNLNINITERHTGSSSILDSILNAKKTDTLSDRKVSLKAGDPLSAAFISLNSQNFPYIYNTINVSNPTLTQNNFTILENGVRQQNAIKVTPPSSGGNSKLIDIVFIMDNSGSMSGEQLAVENNVINFVDALNASGIDYALGLCRYGQSAGSGAPIAENAGVLTTSGTYFKNTLWQRNVVDGGTEPAFDSIAYSMSHFAFRPGSQKIVVLITDESPDQGTVTDLQAIAALNNQTASINVLTLSNLYHYYDNFFLSTKSGLSISGTPIVPNSSTAAFLNAGEKNYYQIEVTQPGILSVTTVSSIDTYGYLYDANGKELLSNDDSGDGSNFLLSRTILPGTYYIGVRGYRNTTTGSYTLNSTFTNETLTSIGANSSTPASLSAGEYDYYKIEVPHFGTLAVTTVSGLSTHGYLYDAKGNELLNSGYGGAGSNFLLSKIVPSGTYYVAVKGYNSSTTGNYTLNSTFTSSSLEPVPGALYLITDPFEGILDDISTLLSSSYLVRYQSSNPSLNGQLRTVTIQINANGGQVAVTKSYTPGAAPVITRTASTIAYESKAWAENIELSVDVIVTDGLAPYTSSVTLYYKTIGNSNYIGVNMTNSQNNVWTANIPANIVLTPGVSYYISATDGESTVTLPSSNAQSNPFVISVLPNEAPVVSNVSESVLSNEEISVSAVISDTTNYLDKVSLYYRERGDLAYRQISMTLTAGNNYEALIPTLGMTEGVEYYIYARDDFAVVTTSGTPDKPIYMSNRICLVPIITYILNSK